MLRTRLAPGAPRHADLGIGERGANLGAERGVDDLGVRVDQDQRLQLVAGRGCVENQVVAAAGGSTAANANTSESGSDARRTPGSA